VGSVFSLAPRTGLQVGAGAYGFFGAEIG